MRNLRLLIEYDGTGFYGWQSQRRGPTVQGALEDAIERLTGRRESLHAAGRTDSGVHALGQVAAFRTDSRLAPQVMKNAINAMLPQSIRVIEAAPAPEDFHPRFGARAKLYRYVISNTAHLSPFAARYAWRVRGALDLDAMANAAGALVGRHDFRSFMGAGSDVKTTEREVYSLTVSEAPKMGFMGAELAGRFVVIEARADGFLRHMVRNIVGTLVLVGGSRLKPGDMAGILKAKDRSAAGPTAPGRGLFLVGVEYQGP